MISIPFRPKDVQPAQFDPNILQLLSTGTFQHALTAGNKWSGGNTNPQFFPSMMIPSLGMVR